MIFSRPQHFLHYLPHILYVCKYPPPLCATLPLYGCARPFYLKARAVLHLDLPQTPVRVPNLEHARELSVRHLDNE